MERAKWIRTVQKVKVSTSKLLEINFLNYHFYLPKTPNKAG